MGTWGTTVGWDINYFAFGFNKNMRLIVFCGNITVTPASSVA